MQKQYINSVSTVLVPNVHVAFFVSRKNSARESVVRTAKSVARVFVLEVGVRLELAFLDRG